MQKRKFAFLSALVALLCAFTFVFAACDNGGESASSGDPLEGYEKVEAEDTGSAPAEVVIATGTVSVPYGGTVQVTATVRNPVAGTLTWSVAQGGETYVSVAEGGSAAITADSATATATLSGVAVTQQPVTVTASFTEEGATEAAASASCSVTVVPSAVTVNVASSAPALYTDGEGAEKSATLTATVSGISDATVNWAITAGEGLATLSAETGSSVTLTAADTTETGSVTVTASVSYNNGAEEATATGTVTVGITKYALNELASIDFDTVDGTSLGVVSGHSGVTATSSDANAIQSTIKKGESGNAFKVTGDTPQTPDGKGDYLENQDEDEALTVDFAGTQVSIEDSETLSFSFEYYFNNAEGIGDWSSLVSINQRDGMRATFMNIWGTAGGYPGKGGVLQGSYAYDAFSKALPNTWHHAVVEMSKTNGVRFYFNGALVCVYAYSDANTAALVDAAFYWLNQKGTFVFFGDIEGGKEGSDLYVDNVRITKNISATKLYQAVSAA